MPPPSRTMARRLIPSLALPPAVRLLLLLAGVLAAQAACAPVWSARAFRTTSGSAPHVAGSGVRVRSRNGRIDLLADPARSEVRVEARLTCTGATRAEAEARVANARLQVERGDDGTLMLAPIFPGGGEGGDGADITVRVPEAEGVAIETTNGSVRVRGASGRLEIGTSNGPVTVTAHDGPVRVRTTNGPVVATGLGGAAEIETTNARVILSLRPDSAGPVQVEDTNGAVRVTVGPAFAGRLVMTSSNAAVSINDHAGIVAEHELSRHHAEVLFARPGKPSRLSSSNGPIALITVP